MTEIRKTVIDELKKMIEVDEALVRMLRNDRDTTVLQRRLEHIDAQLEKLQREREYTAQRIANVVPDLEAAKHRLAENQTKLKHEQRRDKIEALLKHAQQLSALKAEINDEGIDVDAALAAGREDDE